MDAGGKTRGRDDEGRSSAPDGCTSLVGFGRSLRAHGLPIGTNRILTFCRSAAALAPLDRDRLYWAGRSSLIAHPDHVETYDRVFDDYFGRGRIKEVLTEMFSGISSPAAPEVLTQVAPLSSGDDSSETDEADASEIEVLRLIASEAEVLRTKSFDRLTVEERVLTDRLIRKLALTLPVRRSRRADRAPKGGRFDLRRTLRSSMRTQAEPLKREWLTRREVARPLVLILDVSGSMAPFTRALMHLAFAAMSPKASRVGTRRHRVEVFCFGTHLTRVTRAMRSGDPDRALAEVARLVRDWEGGTRIGESLKTLLDQYSQAAGMKGAVVVLCSDGLERGDPILLAAQMARLHRIAHDLIWVNPLKATTGYEPLARGMASALPHVDRFLPGHNLKSLEELSRALAVRS
ncbi:MAG: VWA domain-containing protein [Actinobacteria bacterium]|nr:VWA domain-containing protein [Actinomycetota bacterium]